MQRQIRKNEMAGKKILKGRQGKAQMQARKDTNKHKGRQGKTQRQARKDVKAGQKNSSEKARKDSKADKELLSQRQARK